MQLLQQVLLLEPKEIIENEQKPVDSSRPDNENEYKQGFGPHMSNSDYSQAVNRGCVRINNGGADEDHGSMSLRWNQCRMDLGCNSSSEFLILNVYCLQIQRTESY